jgi:hypothetical protein
MSFLFTHIYLEKFRNLELQLKQADEKYEKQCETSKWEMKILKQKIADRPELKRMVRKLRTRCKNLEGKLSLKELERVACIERANAETLKMHEELQHEIAKQQELAETRGDHVRELEEQLKEFRSLTSELQVID